MHIAIVGMYPAHADQIFEGIMRVTASLAEAFAALPDTEVTVLTAHRIRDMLKKTVIRKKRNLTIKKMNYLTYIFHLLRKDLYDVIHIHGVSLFTVLSLLYQLRNRQNRNTVYTSHGLVVMEKNLGYRYSVWMVLFEKLLIRFSHLITTVSAGTKGFILKYYSVPEKKVTVIGNGVDSDVFTPVRTINKNKSSHNQILFVGTLLPVKGLDFLFTTIQNIHHSFTLNVVGKDTPYFNMLRLKYPSLFRQKKVLFHGAKSQDELKKMYTFCAFLILPSFYDQYPQVVLEAQAMGKPVILSDRIGSSDLIQQGRNGYVVSYGNHEELKKRIIYLIEHPLKCRQMGQFARITAEQNSWKKIALKYRQFFPILNKE